MSDEPINQGGKAATIEDVARMAGVSIATVSRAIRNPEKVAESTRKKVTAAISRTGYTANAMAQSLRTQKSKMVMVLTPSISDPNFAGLLTGMEKAANEAGYGVLIGNTEGSTSLEQNHMRFLSSGMVDGLILLTGHLPVVGSPKPAGFKYPPLVAVGRPVETEAVPYVGVDDVGAAKIATEYLISLGHRKIVYIGSDQTDPVSDWRYQGYLDGLSEASDTITPWKIDAGTTNEAGRAAVERLFIKDTLPTAFFCNNDDVAVGVMSALRLRGYNVPKEFSVIGFDDTSIASYISPALTTLRQPRSQIGHSAMELLLQIIAGGLPDKVPDLFRGDLTVRESCGPAPGAAPSRG